MSEPLRSLASLTNRALVWLEANLSFFDPFQNTDAPEGFTEKTLVELALMCSCLQRQPAFSQNARVRGLMQFVSQIRSAPVFRERFFRVSSAFIPQLQIAVYLRECDLLNDEREWQAIQEFIKASNATSVERLPYQMLELRYLLDKGGFTHQLPSYEALSHNSILSRHINPIYVTNLEAYTITHTLFYLSDFGARPILGLSPARVRHAHWIVHHLLGMYIYRGDWDLVGELLICCYCLKKTDSDLYAMGWQALMRTQDSDGAIPGPHYDHHEGENLESERKRRYVFEHFYHTTLIAAIVGALCPPGQKHDGT